MSAELANTGFEGYPIGPLLLPASVELMDYLREDEVNIDIDLELIADVHCGQTLYHPKTDDGYKWLGGVVLNVRHSNIAILFPASADDRTIAVYIDGDEIPDEQLNDLLLHVLDTIEEGSINADP